MDQMNKFSWLSHHELEMSMIKNTKLETSFIELKSLVDTLLMRLNNVW